MKKQIKEKRDLSVSFKTLYKISLLDWEKKIQELIIKYGEEALFEISAEINYGYYNDCSAEIGANLEFTRYETDEEEQNRVLRSKKAKVSAAKRKITLAANKKAKEQKEFKRLSKIYGTKKI